MAKSVQNKENFFANNIFTFNSYSCIGEVERCFVDPGSDQIDVLKVQADKATPIKFAFSSKVGLVRLNADGSIAESNVLGKLLAIDDSRLENYIDFFKRNGFIVPITFKGCEIINQTQLQAVINRLHATLELMSTITDMSRTSYEKIVRLIFYHLFAPIVSVETKDEKYKYISSRHTYTTLLDRVDELPKDERLKDTFNNSEFFFQDSLGETVLPADFVATMLNGSPEGKYEIGYFKPVFTVYCAPRNTVSKSNLLINDFVFHYLYEVGMIDHVDLEKTYYVNDEVHKDAFSEKLKRQALIVAKLIIREEIDANLRRVRPTYDINKLEPAWNIDSLLSALYFGLFYMRPNVEVYRRCANPKCGEFFLVSVTSQKKKYCCKECMSRAMQARHRAKLKAAENSTK